ncbi:MAG: serine hydrolase domain-containing protein [Rhizomicrobium sp.]
MLAKLQAYIDTYHRKSTPQVYLGLHEVTGDLSVLKLETNEPDHIVAILGEALSDDVLRVEYQIDPKDQTKLTFAQIAGWERPDDLAIPRLSQTEALKALNAHADKLVAEDKFMGGMLIENHGKLLLDKAWGYGDRGQEDSAQADRQVPTGLHEQDVHSGRYAATRGARQALARRHSGTISYQLSEQGDREQSYDSHAAYPCRRKPATSSATISTSTRLKLKTLADYVKLYGSRAPEFPPGSQSSYSNFGFILLGMIVQTVSGEDYYDYVRDHIFKPAGMTDTASLPESEMSPAA